MPVLIEPTTELRHEVAGAVGGGEWPQRALVRFGVPGADASRWLAQGETDAQEGVESDLAELWRAIDQAEADCEADWVQRAAGAAATGRKGIEKPGSRPGTQTIGGPVRCEDYLKLLQARFPDRWRTGVARRSSSKESMEETLRRIQAES